MNITKRLEATADHQKPFRGARATCYERFGTHYNNPSFGSAAEREVVVVVYRLTMKRDVLRRD